MKKLNGQRCWSLYERTSSVLLVKQLFAILKYGARVTSMETMYHIFLTCCSIYNQRMRQLGKDEPWENIFINICFLTSCEGPTSTSSSELSSKSSSTSNGNPTSASGTLLCISTIRWKKPTSSTVSSLVESNHFSYCAQNKMIKWPRENKQWHTYNPNKRNVVEASFNGSITSR